MFLFFNELFFFQNHYVHNIKEFIGAIETKVVYIQNLFQNKCEVSLQIIMYL
jgi:hypothetical protein